MRNAESRSNVVPQPCRLARSSRAMRRHTFFHARLTRNCSRRFRFRSSSATYLNGNFGVRRCVAASTVIATPLITPARIKTGSSMTSSIAPTTHVIANLTVAAMRRASLFPIMSSVAPATVVSPWPPERERRQTQAIGPAFEPKVHKLIHVLNRTRERPSRRKEKTGLGERQGELY